MSKEERTITDAAASRILTDAAISLRGAGMRRILWRGSQIGLLFLGLLWMLFASSAPVLADDGVNHRAALVVRYEDGTTQTSCVAFSEQSISGEELLRRAGLTLVADYSSSIGNAICSINGQGCAYPAEDCFCRCQGIECEYWAYYRWNGTAWQYSQLGAAATQVFDGALEGWTWGPGNFSTATIPPSVSYGDICVAPTATPTATATSTATATPTATSTATPTSTAIPTQVVSESAPEAHFEATMTTLRTGECAVLSWVTWDAESVTLNGSKVMAQDRQEVCPAASGTYTLVAVNSAGQVSREIALSVQGQAATSVPVTQMPAVQPTSPTAQTAGVSAASAPSPAPLPAVESVGATVPMFLTATATIAVQVAPIPQSTEEGGGRSDGADGVAPSRPLLALSQPATSTPRVQRRSVFDAGPTPTPILVAMQPASAQQSPSGGSSTSLTSGASHANGPAGYVAPDRAFQASLLPGYAAFLLVASMLAGSGAWVVRRRMVPREADRH